MHSVVLISRNGIKWINSYFIHKYIWFSHYQTYWTWQM